MFINKLLVLSFVASSFVVTTGVGILAQAQDTQPRFILPIMNPGTSTNPFDSAAADLLTRARNEQNPANMDLLIDQAITVIGNERMDPAFKDRIINMLKQAKTVPVITDGVNIDQGAMERKRMVLKMALEQLAFGKLDTGIITNPPFPAPNPLTATLGTALNMDGNFLYQLLVKTGVSKIDYAEMNNQLRNKYPYYTTEQLADMIIKNTTISTTALAVGSSAIALMDLQVPGMGTAFSVVALPMDLIFTFKKQAMMVLQLADLYNYELSTIDREVDTTIILALAMGGIKSADRVVLQASKAVTAIKYGALKLTQTELMQKLLSKFSFNAALKTLTDDAAKEIAEKVGDKALSTKVAVVSVLVNGTITAVETFGLGKVTKKYFSKQREDQIKHSYEALFVAPIRDGIFKLVTLAVAYSRPPMTELALDDATDREMQVVKNLAIRANVTQEKNSAAFARLVSELHNYNTLPMAYVNNLGKQDVTLRESIASLVLEMQLLDGDRTPKEVEIFDKVQNEILGLTGPRFDQKFKALESFIMKNKRRPKDLPSIAGLAG